MGMTMTQKIFAHAAGVAEVQAGALVNLPLDIALGNDITTPVAIDEFERFGFDSVFDKDKICIVLDHFTPNKDIQSANMSARSRAFAKKYNITHFYDVGKVGVEHALLPEKGIVKAGQVIIGADSHTCTYGALGAFSTGVGSTDLCAGMKSGYCWFKVPSAISFVLTGSLPPYVSGKDVILHIIGLIGVDGALYRSMEFSGEGVAALSMDDRFTIANMAIEAGAKNGIFPVDAATKAYMAEHNAGDYTVFAPDADAVYDTVIEIDLSTILPTVSLPHLPENARTVRELPKTSIDQVVIGSCTNGRISDLAKAAAVLQGRQVAAGVRVLIIPATQDIYLEALRAGYLETFMLSGCVISPPTCGPCLGGYMGILAAGERCVSTTNRNFVGRMGDVSSEIYLASPETAAASAVLGYIGTPDMLEGV